MTGAIVLTIYACIVTQPGECRQHPLTFDEPGLTPRRCVMQAMPQLAAWSGDHPSWEIRRWWCTSLEMARRGI